MSPNTEGKVVSDQLSVVSIPHPITDFTLPLTAYSARLIELTNKKTAQFKSGFQPSFLSILF